MSLFSNEYFHEKLIQPELYVTWWPQTGLSLLWLCHVKHERTYTTHTISFRAFLSHVPWHILYLLNLKSNPAEFQLALLIFWSMLLALTLASTCSFERSTFWCFFFNCSHQLVVIHLPSFLLINFSSWSIFLNLFKFLLHLLTNTELISLSG